MKILFLESDQEEKKYISQAVKDEGLDLELDFSEKTAKGIESPRSDVEIISVFVGSKVDEEVLDKFPNLKFLTTRSTGYDHIDLEECKKRGILVSNVPSYGEHTVAEYAFGLILNLSRRIHEAYDQVREDGNFSVKGLRGFDLKGKTIGVVGTGNIGKNVVKIAKGFGMKVVAHDVYPDENFSKEMNFEYKKMEEVLKESDIITLHVPYLKSTYHLINKDNIYKIKKGAYLINTSRGGVVETEALVKALKDNHLAGAGIDVLEEEGVLKDEFGFLLSEQSNGYDARTILADHALIDMSNVIVTPHNAFNTRGAWERILNTTISSIRGFLKGDIINAVEKK